MTADLCIFVKYDPPPIPDRRNDWSAVTKDYDGPGSPIGWGRTRIEAITDLVEQIEDQEEGEQS